MYVIMYVCMYVCIYTNDIEYSPTEAKIIKINKYFLVEEIKDRQEIFVYEIKMNCNICWRKSK